MLTLKSTKCRYNVCPDVSYSGITVHPGIQGGLTGMIAENATYVTCERDDKGGMRFTEQGVSEMSGGIPSIFQGALGFRC